MPDPMSARSKSVRQHRRYYRHSLGRIVSHEHELIDHLQCSKRLASPCVRTCNSAHSDTTRALRNGSNNGPSWLEPSLRPVDLGWGGDTEQMRMGAKLETKGILIYVCTAEGCLIDYPIWRGSIPQLVSLGHNHSRKGGVDSIDKYVSSHQRTIFGWQPSSMVAYAQGTAFACSSTHPTRPIVLLRHTIAATG